MHSSEPGGLASRVRDSSNLDLSQEMCVVVSEFRHLLVRAPYPTWSRESALLSSSTHTLLSVLQAFVGSRLARHVFVGVLFQVSSAGVCPQVTRLLALTQVSTYHSQPALHYAC